MPRAWAFPAGRGEGFRLHIDDHWDAGDMGCGELVLALRQRLRAMPGQVLLLTATDPGAPEDLPAWCRMTGHQLLQAEHPRYWLQARPAVASA